ncbi:MAG TPA: hypothetical protein VK745_29880 [Polyangiaceae bacterium]|jgi:hypothetical protein|nr:hypothetical protein [Polyangiaceae bacterium]
MKFRLTLAATLLLGALPLKAHAQMQPWLANRQYGEGIGVRVGDLELHPGIAGQVGYDSNYFLRAPQENPIAAYRLIITPSISLETLGAQRRDGLSPAGPAPLQFRANAYVGYNELVAADSKYSTQVQDQRHLDAGTDLSLSLFPTGQVGADSYFNFVRTVQPSNDTNTENAFNRDGIRVGAGATWRPGGGLFSWRLGYELLYNYFELAPYQDLNNYQNQINMRGSWRFLPRTALLYEGAYTWVTYARNTVQGDGAIASSRIGLNGLITNHFALLALVGWAGTFYNGGTAVAAAPPQQFDSIIGQVELKWFLSGQQGLDVTSAPVGLSWVALGYTRDVNNSYLGDFYQRDRGYAQLSYLLGGAFVGGLSAGIANLAFPDSPEHSAFSEQRFDASLFAEYRVSNTFGLNATVNYLDNITGVFIPPGGTAAPAAAPVAGALPGDYLAFQQWQAFLGVRWFL